MNVFVLGTGRCGSTTFVKACSHIKNYSSGHETRAGEIGSKRLLYPEMHIEADNRLSWYLGRLDALYGKMPFYVHLYRDRDATAKSLASRTDPGSIMRAYASGIVINPPGQTWPTNYAGESVDPLSIAYDYIDTVTANIDLFLQDKVHLKFPMEEAKEWYPYFWHKINAEGNLSYALGEWDVKHNAS